MIRRPPGSTRTDTLFPYTTLFRSGPVSARDVKLALEDGVIRGDAIIARPKDGRRLALVSLTHNLSEGSGKADLDVPRLVFGDDLQPEELTPLTLGVIANVGGAIEGGGQIRWSPEGVTSDGAFESDGLGQLGSASCRYRVCQYV